MNYHRYERDEFVELYEKFYSRYPDAIESKLYGFPKKGLNIVTKDVLDAEDDKEWPVDSRIFLWKAGRIKDFVEYDKTNEIKIYNHLGNEIENSKLFFDAISKCETITGKSFENDFTEILSIRNSEEIGLKHVGTVYLITVLHFLYPDLYSLYDYFAHCALKALYLRKAPSQVFVGSAPNAKNVKRVSAMYNEFNDLAKADFGVDVIDRKLDRSLWVYGHLSTPYHEICTI